MMICHGAGINRRLLFCACGNDLMPGQTGSAYFEILMIIAPISLDITSAISYNITNTAE